MIKDFDGWNKVKKDLNHTEHKPGCYPREIWICSVGANVGVETDGKREAFARPVLVLKVFNRDMFWGIPFTSKDRVGSAFYPILWGGRKSVAVLSQMRLFSSKRLDRKVETIKEEDFIKLRNQLISLIKSETPPCGGESRRPKP
jgi:mRNA-degrading endonuclease toxin of MazEF toxin-antitoxin module